jgi:hypothetical protein
MNAFTYLEITGTASASPVNSDRFMFAPDGIISLARRDSEKAFDEFFEMKDSGDFFSIKMEHVTYNYGDDQDPYEIPLRFARDIERHVVADWVEGGMGVYV